MPEPLREGAETHTVPQSVCSKDLMTSNSGSSACRDTRAHVHACVHPQPALAARPDDST